MRTPDPPGARRITRLKINSLASPTTTFGSKSVDLTQIPGITRGNVIQTRLDPPTRKEPEMTDQDLEELKQIAQNATPGQWTTGSTDFTGEFDYTVYGVKPIAPTDWAPDNSPAFAYCEGMDAQDATYVAAFDPPTVLALIDRIEKLEATIQQVRDLHEPEVNSVSALYPDPQCTCGENYPCPTVLALEGETDEV